VQIECNGRLMPCLIWIVIHLDPRTLDLDPVSGSISRLHMRMIENVLLAAAEAALRIPVTKEACLFVE